jgi:hypothetical protein
MRRIIMRTVAQAVVAALTLYSGTALAQFVSAEVTVAAPTITFEAAPPLVYVSPGVMVVEDYGEEVFYVRGWYWCNRGGVWFRTQDYRGGWVTAPPRYVPTRLEHFPPGQYRNFRGGPGHPVHYAEPVRPGRAYASAPVGRPSHGYAPGPVGRPSHGYAAAPVRGPMPVRGPAPAPHYAAPMHGGGGGGGMHMAGPSHGGGGGRGHR